MSAVPIDPQSKAFRDAWKRVKGSVEYGIFPADAREVRAVLERTAAAADVSVLDAPRAVRAIAPAHVRNGHTLKAVVPLQDGDDIQAAKHYALCMLGWVLQHVEPERA